MIEKQAKVFVCEGCGAIYLEEHKIQHHNGVEFCSTCIDDYAFYHDPTYGVLMFPKKNIFFMDSPY